MAQPQASAVLRGVLRLARGRADGLALFGDSVPRFTASLAPFIALTIVGTLLTLAEAPVLDALGGLFASWCAVLAPLVLSWEVARLWKREELWLRYATAFNWSVWVLPALWLLLAPVLHLLLPPDAAPLVLQVVIGCYGFWLHWFIARNALALGGGRAVVLVLLINAVTFLVVVGPSLLMDNG